MSEPTTSPAAPTLREAAERVLDLIDTAVREDDDTATLYDELSDTALDAVDGLRAALARADDEPTLREALDALPPRVRLTGEQE